jgi:hypothetical protein
MSRTTILLAAVLLLAGATAGCSKSYDDTVNDCVAALKERPAGNDTKPDACEVVKEDDYTELTISQHLEDNGWVDENGDVDMGKILEDATETP